jgi:glycosyltransferase involved in cell wall biosynthesis
MPFFSIVIPLYNKEKYIQRTLDSVLAQSFADFEVVVVDDGSTDNGTSVVRSFGDQRIRLIQQKNSGGSAARNRGIAEAKGKWISLLDADDEYKPDFLKEAWLCIEQFPQVGAVYTRFIEVKGEGKTYFPKERDGYEFLDDYCSYAMSSQGCEIWTGAITVRADIFESTGLFPVDVKVGEGEDVDMWLRIAWVAPIAHIPRALSVYHLEASGSQWADNCGRNPCWFATYQEWLNNNRIPEKLRPSSRMYYNLAYLRNALHYATHGRKQDARRLLHDHGDFRYSPKYLAIKTYLFAYTPDLFLHFIQFALSTARRVLRG